MKYLIALLERAFADTDVTFKYRDDVSFYIHHEQLEHCFSFFAYDDKYDIKRTSFDSDLHISMFDLESAASDIESIVRTIKTLLVDDLGDCDQSEMFDIDDLSIDFGDLFEYLGGKEEIDAESFTHDLVYEKKTQAKEQLINKIREVK